MKDILNILRKDKVTSSAGVGVGILTVGVIALSLFGIDLGKISGISTEVIIANVGALVSSVFNLWAKDRKQPKGDNNREDENKEKSKETK